MTHREGLATRHRISSVVTHAGTHIALTTQRKGSVRNPATTHTQGLNGCASLQTINPVHAPAHSAGGSCTMEPARKGTPSHVLPVQATRVAYVRASSSTCATYVTENPKPYTKGRAAGEAWVSIASPRSVGVFRRRWLLNRAH